MHRALLCAVGFLTYLPLPQLELDDRDFARSVGFFPWVGALISGLLWGSSILFALLEPRLAALLVVALWALITGGFHLDGLADTADGLSGGQGDRERSLAIMRDSRIGAHGALALVLMVALKWAALEELLATSTTGWLIAPVSARFVCVLLIARFPYARAQGLARPFAGVVGAPALLLAASALLLSVLALGPSALFAALFGAGCALAFAFWISRLLAGLSGDVYGAAIELAELSTLLALNLPALR